MPEASQPVVDTPWSRSAEEVLEALAVSPDEGLDAQTVRERRRRHGANRLEQGRKRSTVAILLDQFKNVIILLLAVAAAVSFVFGQRLEAAAILVAIALNVAIGFFTELRATRSMEALQRLGRVEARVRRAGRIRSVPSGEVVPGDILLLEGGDVVAADLRLVEASRLAADESALTGESVPVSKQVDPVEDDADLSGRRSMLFKGTALTRGSAEGVVTATGMDTELGQIAALAEASEGEETPLEKRLDRLGYRLIWLTLGIAVLISITGLITRQDFLLMIETAIALAVAAAPEGLPMVATIGLARGMWRMLKRNALMNRLSAVETLGSTSVIFTDKTGTLTENRMTVTRILVAGREPKDIDAVQVKPGEENVFQNDQGPVDPEETPLLRAALETGVLCNNAGLNEEAEDERGVGDPLEIALLEAGRLADLKRETLLEARPEVREEAFDHEVKMMATIHEDGDGWHAAVKGAPEAVLEASRRIAGSDGERDLSTAERQAWQDRNETLAAEGLRVLGVATRRLDDREADPYNGLRFIGLVAMEDPPRREVPDAVAACGRAGIDVVMVTGDHPATAGKVAALVGIAGEEDPDVVQGRDLQHPEDVSPEERRKQLQHRVFARVSPKQKLDLIGLHQAEGAVVAMTGDGVNDAPALKKADIGIAMGRRGTQVAREAADMVLQDDAFGTIVAAIAQGRAIFENIRKFILFLLSGNVGQILIVGVAILAGAPLPLLPLQILYLNMIGDVFPALALAAGEGDESRMREPPRDASESILTRDHWLAICAYGALIAAAVLAVFWIALEHWDLPPDRAVTVSFLGLSFARLWHVFNMRSTTSGIVDNEITRNPYVWGALVLCIALLLTATYLPGLSGVLRLVGPTMGEWGLILACSFVPLVVGQVAILALARRRA